MKYFVVSDIHGFYDKMIEALDLAGFDINNPNHIFISLGDLLDRGNQPLECLKFVNSLPQNRKILIQGNHESLLQEMAKRGFPCTHDYHNGTYQTAAQLCNVLDYLDEEKYSYVCKTIMLNSEIQKYYANLCNYAEIGTRIFVHGWIPISITKKGIRSIDNWRKGNWEDARWSNGMNLWNQGYRISNKTIYCGHYHVSWGWKKIRHQGSETHSDAIWEPFIDNGICAIDACTAHSGKVNCVTFED